MAATVTYLQTASNANDLTAYTFSAQNFGTEDAARHIIAVVYTRDIGTGAKTLSTITIGGVSATILVQAQGTGSGANSCVCAIAIAAVPAGTSGDVVVTWSEAVLRCAISLYASVGASATAHDTASSTAADPSVTLDIPAGGFAIGGWSGTNTVTWTGLTEDHDTAFDNSEASSASDEFVGAESERAIAVTENGVDPALVCASFAEDGGGGAFSITAEAGSYALTGTAAALRATRKITAAGGSYAVSGTAAALKAGRKLAAAIGSYVLSGVDATLTHGTPGAFTLVAEAGSYVVTGTAAALRATRKIVAASGSYAQTGTVAALKAGRKLAAAVGSYALSGADATLTYDELQHYSLACSSGSYALTGTAATLTYDFIFVPVATLDGDVSVSRLLASDVLVSRALAATVEIE